MIDITEPIIDLLANYWNITPHIRRVTDISDYEGFKKTDDTHLFKGNDSLPDIPTTIGFKRTTIYPEGYLLLQLDEFNPKLPRYQLVVINRPSRTLFICPNVVRIEQEVLLELHIRPIKYDPSTIDNTKTIFSNVKREIMRILNHYRFDSLFDVPSSYVINMTNWINDRIPRGFGEQKEPLEFISRLTVNIIYFEIDV